MSIPHRAIINDVLDVSTTQGMENEPGPSGEDAPSVEEAEQSAEGEPAAKRKKNHVICVQKRNIEMLDKFVINVKNIFAMNILLQL